jgi:hypothetical protein
VYPDHRKLWSGSGEGRKTAAHTHRGSKSPSAREGLSSERNQQLPKALDLEEKIKNGYVQKMEEEHTNKMQVNQRKTPKNNKQKPQHIAKMQVIPTTMV